VRGQANLDSIFIEKGSINTSIAACGHVTYYYWKVQLVLD